MQLDKFFNLYAEEEKCKQFFKEQLTYIFVVYFTALSATIVGNTG